MPPFIRQLWGVGGRGGTPVSGFEFARFDALTMEPEDFAIEAFEAQARFLRHQVPSISSHCLHVHYVVTSEPVNRGLSWGVIAHESAISTKSCSFQLLFDKKKFVCVSTQRGGGMAEFNRKLVGEKADAIKMLTARFTSPDSQTLYTFHGCRVGIIGCSPPDQHRQSESTM